MFWFSVCFGACVSAGMLFVKNFAGRRGCCAWRILLKSGIRSD